MKPWLEKWSTDDWIIRAGAWGDPDARRAEASHSGQVDIELACARAEFIAAAPDMCRALLKIEAHYMCCIGCIHSQNADQRAGRIHVDCYIDAALTKAGLPDQASRDAARKELGL